MREEVGHEGCTTTMNVFSGEQPTGLWYYDRIRIFSVQTTLGTRPGLGNQTFYKIPSDQRLTSGERGCSLDNGPKVNHREIGDKAKTLKKKLCYTYRIWFKNTIVHNVVSRKFKLPFYRQPGHLVFDIFCSIFPDTDPSKHGINTEIIS